MQSAFKKKTFPRWFLTFSPSTDPKSDGWNHRSRCSEEHSGDDSQDFLWGKNQRDWYKQERQNRNLKQRIWFIIECIYAWCSITQSWQTLCDPMDCSPPGSYVHGIFQARILEWAAISISKGFSQTSDWTQVLHCREILYHLAAREAPTSLICGI